MAFTLELQFTTEQGGTARLTIDNPKEPIDPAVVKNSMEQIVATGVFHSPTGKMVAPKSARLIERNITPYEIV
jgi:hypothetical protein